VTFLVILGLIVAAFFAVVFFSKNRVGIPILAMAAGAMLASMWVGDLTPLIAGAGIIIVQPPLESLVAAAMTLLPAVLLSARGSSYSALYERIFGGVVFALFATALLLPSIGSALVIDATARPIYDFFVQYRTIIVTAGLVIGVFDLLFFKVPKHAKH
jgi:hypothetical protein